jgi:hypothetical protein
MRRLYVVAALVAVFSSAPLFAQMRGGHVGASFGRGFSSHSFGVAGGFSHSGFGHSGFTHVGVGFVHSGGFVHGHPVFVTHGHRGFVSGSPFFFGGSFYWGPGYYPYYYGYPYAYSYPATVASAPPAYYSDSNQDYDHGDLRRDIDELNGKVDHLQQDLESRNYVPRPPARQEAMRQSTMLVFKDKHQEEVQNYAVVGGTLWILDEKKASKVPLEDLDLDATTRLNDERGVEFEVPR